MLLRAKEWSGAYYLSGYAVECALKACIVKQFKKYELPDKTLVADSYIHELSKLVKLASLQPALDREVVTNPVFYGNWNVVKDWKPEDRYRIASDKEAKDMVKAVTSARHGVLTWLRKRW